MTSKSRWIRLATVAFAGGSLVQIAGCLAGLAPTLASYGESLALSALVNAIVQ